MFTNFDFDVIWRSLPYLFYQGMTFTLLLTALATLGGIVIGTLLALMRLELDTDDLARLRSIRYYGGLPLDARTVTDEVIRQEGR